MARLRASFYTLGCRLNQAETALISQSFKNKGYQVVEFGESADVCVINTCTVTEQADAKCRQLVRQALRRSPGAFVAVVGCYAQMAVETLKQIEGVDLIVGNEEKMQVAEFIDTPLKLPEPIVRRRRIGRAPFTIGSVGNYEHATRANLKIQDGCDFMCSFCIIPFARGRARSRAFRDVQWEALELVARGHRELVLTGVNIGTYAHEGRRLLDLIRMLESIEGVGRIRISSIEPTTVSRDLVEYMADSEKLCAHLHIPLQSGDDGILRKMRRDYTVSEYEKLVSWACGRVPNLCLGTDVMVGFPGEGERQFENTRRLLQALPFAYFHVFTYSERHGTPAARMPGRVDPKVRKARSQNLRTLSREKRRRFYLQYVGRTLRVLMEERNEGGWFHGLTDNYVRVGVHTQEDLSNRFVDVTARQLEADTMLSGALAPGP